MMHLHQGMTKRDPSVKILSVKVGGAHPSSLLVMNNTLHDIICFRVSLAIPSLHNGLRYCKPITLYCMLIMVKLKVTCMSVKLYNV